MAYANLTVTFPGYARAAEQAGFAAPTATKVGINSLTVDAPATSGFICPDCEDPTKPYQQYHCPNGHGPFSQGQLRRAVAIADGLVPFDPDEQLDDGGTVGDLFYAIADADKAIAEFRAHPVEQFTAAGFLPGEKMYQVAPVSKGTKNDNQMWAILRAAAADTSHVWMTWLRVKKSVAVYRLGRLGDQVTLTEVRHPSTVRAFDPIDVDVTDEDAEKGAANLLTHCVEDLDVGLYADDTYEAVTTWAQARWDETGGKVPVAVEPTPEVADADLVALLSASLPGADDEDQAREAAKERHPAAAATTGADLLMAAMAHVEAGGDPADFQASKAS